LAPEERGIHSTPTTTGLMSYDHAQNPSPNKRLRDRQNY
jgi:hypothetical protein